MGGGGGMNSSLDSHLGPSEYQSDALTTEPRTLGVGAENITTIVAILIGHMSILY